MATADQYIGRREGIGIGIEGTPGTSVAPQVWMRWLDGSINTKLTLAENESAIGVVEQFSDSDIVSKYVELNIRANVGAKSIGYLMLGMWGTVSTGTAVGGYYPHTFSVKASSIPTSLTFARKTPLAAERFAYGTVDTFELDASAGRYITVKSAIKARVGATSTETIALTTEQNFTSRHITLKVADTVANLGAATAIKASTLKLKVERASEPFVALGDNTSVPAVEFDRGTFEASGEFVIRLTDTQYETDFLANTVKAMSISLVNGSDTLVFTSAQVRYRALEKSSDINGVVTATVQFFCEYNTTATSSIVPVLTNQQSTYTAA